MRPTSEWGVITYLVIFRKKKPWRCMNHKSNPKKLDNLLIVLSTVERGDVLDDGNWGNRYPSTKTSYLLSKYLIYAYCSYKTFFGFSFMNFWLVNVLQYRCDKWPNIFYWNQSFITGECLSILKMQFVLLHNELDRCPISEMMSTAPWLLFYIWFL